MSESNSNLAPTPGSRPLFGRYEILDTLGGGGMASVYRASQRGLAGAVRTVALKVIHPHLSGEDAFVRMFLDEMRVAMALQHRNIVQTLDAGEVGQRHFIAMELVPGCTLRQLMRRSGERPIPLDIALFIAAELCAALHYAHTYQPELTGQPAAVVHRDVSPSNVLLSKDGDVKLTDFGVARARDTMRQQSVSDAVKGKLAYMPPEQARGKAQPASDLFALGATLYELLSKRSLRTATTLEEVLHGPVAVEPLHPLRQEVPPQLDALLSSLLDPAPEGRPSSAELLEGVLRELLAAAQRESDGAHIDMRARLAAYLAELPAEPVSDPAALRLAQALLAEAQAAHSLTGGEGATRPLTAATIPGHGGAGSVSASSTALTAATVAEGGTGAHGEVGTEAYQSPLKGLEAPRGSYSGEVGTETAALAQKTRSPWPWIVLALGVLGIGGGLTVFYLTKNGTPSGPNVSSFASQGFGSGSGVPKDAVPKTPVDGAAAKAKAVGKDAAVSEAKADSKPGERAKPITKRTRRPRGRGTLSVNATRWVEVRVDGKSRGHTPLQDLSLSAGKHTLKLVDPRTKEVLKTRRIRIRPGKPLVIIERSL